MVHPSHHAPCHKISIRIQDGALWLALRDRRLLSLQFQHILQSLHVGMARSALETILHPQPDRQLYINRPLHLRLRRPLSKHLEETEETTREAPHLPLITTSNGDTPLQTSALLAGSHSLHPHIRPTHQVTTPHSGLLHLTGHRLAVATSSFAMRLSRTSFLAALVGGLRDKAPHQMALRPH
jgi:hypothetical protein